MPQQNKLPITKVDRVVYKGLDNIGTISTGTNKGKQFGRSPYQDMRYYEGYHYSEKILDYKFENRNVTLTVRQGLHAVLTEKAALNHAARAIKMIIPKGSIFLLGDKGDVVTNNLIWLDGNRCK